MSEEKKGSFLGGLLVGAAIGGAAYYLFGTEKGKKLQKELKKKAKPYLDDISDLIDGLPEEKERIFESVENVKEAVVEKIEDVKEIGGEIKENIQDNLPHINALQNRGRAMAKRFFKGIKKT